LGDHRRGAERSSLSVFAYDQPRSTGYGVAADIFSNKLEELSRGTMLIDQFLASQLGQEPQVLQLSGRRHRLFRDVHGQYGDRLAAGRRSCRCISSIRSESH